MSEWISVSDRMPNLEGLEKYNFGVEVIITDGKSVTSARWESNQYAKTEKGREPRWVRDGRLWHGCVTHWMPFPEPPK